MMYFHADGRAAQAPRKAYPWLSIHVGTAMFSAKPSRPTAWDRITQDKPKEPT